MNAELTTSQQLGLAEHMLKGAVKGGFIGAGLWKVGELAAQVFPPAAVIVLPAAAVCAFAGATAGAAVSGAEYAMKTSLAGQAVQA